MNRIMVYGSGICRKTRRGVEYSNWNMTTWKESDYFTDMMLRGLNPFWLQEGDYVVFRSSIQQVRHVYGSGVMLENWDVVGMDEALGMRLLSE